MTQSKNDNFKEIDLNEFRSFGYLQELDRVFIHPLGLALQILTDEDNKPFSRFLDFRDDPGGMYFFDLSLDKDKEKFYNVLNEFKKFKKSRLEILEFNIQQKEINLKDNFILSPIIKGKGEEFNKVFIQTRKCMVDLLIKELN